jgi:hypothetical protein
LLLIGQTGVGKTFILHRTGGGSTRVCQRLLGAVHDGHDVA